MFAILAFVAFVIAAILEFAHTGTQLGIIVGIIACGLALLALHTVKPWNPL